MKIGTSGFHAFVNVNLKLIKVRTNIHIDIK